MERLKERSEKETDGGTEEAPFFLIFFTKNN